MRDLSLHILDIVQNSITAKASIISVTLRQLDGCGQLVLEIEDNGIGIDEELLPKVEDPFVTSRTTRKVGLGIPLLKDSALRCDGEFKIRSVRNKGTKVFATFSIDHIDRIPLGDISDTMITLIAANPVLRFILLLESRNGCFKIDTKELVNTLEGVPINEFAVLQWLREYIGDGIKNIFGGVLNEVDS